MSEDKIRAEVNKQEYQDTSMGGTIENPEAEYYYWIDIYKNGLVIGGIKHITEQEAELICSRINNVESVKAERERGEREVCNWGYDSEGVHETSCGQMFQLNDGTLKDNKMKYCCYCGKKIKEYDTEDDLKRLQEGK